MRGLKYNLDYFLGEVFTANEGSKCKVIDYQGCSKVRVKFLDGYGYEYTITLGELRRGEFKNPFHPSVFGVAFFGVGIFKRSVDGVKTPEYACWASLMERLFSNYRKEKFPTYLDCSVCPDWLNFQVFADWYTKQRFYGRGYQLDKDILVVGNRYYSPDTCCLVPSEINSLLIRPNSSKSKYKTGICIKGETGKFLVQLKKFGKQTHVGFYTDLKDAEAAYKYEKERYVKEVAMIWKDKVDEKVFKSLINWEFE